MLKFLLSVVCLMVAVPLALFLLKKVGQFTLVVVRWFAWVIKYCWPMMLIILAGMMHPLMLIPAIAIAVVRYITLFRLISGNSADAKYWGDVR